MSDDPLLLKIDLLRSLRKKANAISISIVQDHEAFELKGKRFWYKRLPSDEKTDLNVTPSCTAWMSLSSARCLIKHRESDDSDIKGVIQHVMKETWDTGGLYNNNAFTTAIVIRSLGFLKSVGVIDDKFWQSLTKPSVSSSSSPDPKLSDEEKRTRALWDSCNGKTVHDILISFLEAPTTSMTLSPFPASPTIGYWLIDACRRLAVDITETAAKEMTLWASAEFRRQLSLVAAKDHATMDPVALAMAASVCKSLKRIAETSETCRDQFKTYQFPSDIELEAAIGFFFDKQDKDSGVWNKYFPIFHYPNSGPNHCWHFEVLEAVIAEFPNILKSIDRIKQLDKALDWLSSNRLEFSHNEKNYRGWNGGGDVQAVRRREPESWPTSVAHMFLSELKDQISVQLKTDVLQRFGNQVRPARRKPEEWDNYMDSDFDETVKEELGDNSLTVKSLIKSEILESAANYGEADSPHMKLDRRRSAVLFGPPGTAKTTLCEAVADYLGWPYLELSPSDFLGRGLEGIYNRVNEVFEDLLDLYGVVILFDEMDGLVRNRESSNGSDPGKRDLELTETMLTTSMLPKLAKLHKNARSVYFMATNYIDRFDGAIIRSGRFDLHVQLGPPSTAEKLRRLEHWFKNDQFDPSDDIKKVKEDAIERFKKSLSMDGCTESFKLFTYGEVGKFFDVLKSNKDCKSVAKAIGSYDPVDLGRLIKKWAGEGKKITLWKDGGAESAELKQFKESISKISRQ